MKKNKLTISLKKYFETKIFALEKATSIAATNMERRLEGMNEFRSQLKDQAAGFIPRTEHDATHRKIEEDIRMLRESRALLEGKASQLSVNISIIIAVLSLLIAGVGMFGKWSQNLKPTNQPLIIYTTPTNFSTIH